jgi:proline iminopeptidase
MLGRQMLRPLALTLGTTLLTVMAPAITAKSPGPHNRAEATRIVAEMRRIVTPGGIERLEKVRIGGIDQWVSIRGFDRRNPVLLFIHGGPGFPSMPTSWHFARGWDEYFTTVHWDQRGAGKTFLANDPAQVAPTMKAERLVADAEELIDWLRKEFGKEKIFVIGHSWGSYVGLTIAQKHPEWLHAYIGMGQITNAAESERRGWQFALDKAKQSKNEAAVRELQAMAPYAAAGKVVPIKDLYAQRKWIKEYDGAVYGRKGYDHEDVGTALSPDYTDEDVQKIWDGNDFSEKHMLQTVLTRDMSKVTALKCPMILLAGRHDYVVNSQLAAEWFEKLQAPSKSLVWFEHSAHDVMNEEPGKLFLSLVQYARPIAERAGDIPRSQ